MAIAWFICGYKVDMSGKPRRYCAMDDFTAQIYPENGAWSESEVLGGYAVVKVRASDATLTTIAGTTGFQRIPTFIGLTDVMTSLTTAQRTAIEDKVLAMGYTQAEIDAVMGGTLGLWRQKDLGILLRFIAQRRLVPRWDDIQQQIVLDGAAVACRPIADVDVAVQ